MSEIIFIYKNKEIIMLCGKNEKLGIIFKRFCQKTQLVKKNIQFLFGGEIINEEMMESQIPKNKYNEKIIFVKDIEKNKFKEDVIIKSNEIICPKCKNNACISIKNNKITLFRCCNGHKIENLSIEDFNDTQNINISSIICRNCNIRNKGNVNKNQFYFCLNCKYNLCPLCINVHNNRHNIINYDIKNYICLEHCEIFSSYCKTCNKDICIQCEENHDEHDIDYYQRLKHNSDQIEDCIINIDNSIDKINEIINKLIEKLNKVKNIIEKYYDIIQSIYKTTNFKYFNHSILYNINFLFNNEINQDIMNIINEKEIINKIDKILKFHDKFGNQNINKVNSKEDTKAKIIKKTKNILKDYRPVHKSMKGLCQELINKDWITSQKVFDVMMKVDRADFAPSNPYENNPQRIGCNVVISAPLLHAYCLECLKDYLKPGCKALDIGSGSGYITVAMSKMMDDRGYVIGIEHMKELYEFGYKNISKHHRDLIVNKKIELICGDGRKGYKEKAPFDCIHVGAAAMEPPKEFIEQLKPGGRLIMPLGPQGNQYIYAIDKLENGKIKKQKGLSVRYVALTDAKKQLIGNN